MSFVTMFSDAIQTAMEELTGMIAQVITFLPQLVAGLIVFVIFFLIARLVRRWGRRISGRVRAPVAVEKLIVASMYITALLIAAMLGLAAMGVKVYPLITGLGVSGLVVGFAIKDILENLLAGALLLIQRPFELGDLIEVDGIKGTVERIQIRATTLKTPDNIEVIVPNRTVYNSNITNFHTYPLRRWELSLGIGYGQDLPRILEVVLDTVRGTEEVASEREPFVLINDFGDSAVSASLYYFIDQTEHDLIAVRNKVAERIEAIVDDEEIDLPYPTSIVINKEG